MSIMDTVLEDMAEVSRFLSRDEWQEALDFVKKRSHLHYLYQVTEEVLECMIGLGITETGVEIGLSRAYNALNIVDELRRKYWAITRIFSTPDYDEYTDDECHAELLHAELCAFISLLLIATRGALLDFIHAALFIRKSYSSYQECHRIWQHRTTWESDLSRDTFSSGTLAAVGLIDIAISFVPPPFSTILSFIGYSGDREYGLKMVHAAYKCKKSFRWPMIGLVLLAWHGMGIHMLGLSVSAKSDREMMMKIGKEVLSRFPDTVYLPLVNAAMSLSDGQFETVLSTVDSITHNFKVRRMLVFTNFAKVISYGFLTKWSLAEKLTKEIENDMWSHASSTYGRACLYVMMMEAERDNPDKRGEYRREAVELLKLVPERKRPIGGTLYHEQYQIDMSVYYGDHPEDMSLPIYEALAIMNIFPMISLEEKFIQPILEAVDRKWRENESNPNHREYYNRRASLLLIRGHCLKQLADGCADLLTQAAECFNNILEMEDAIDFAKHLPPQAAYEMGRIYHTLYKDDRESAMRMFKKALRYKGYSTEIIIGYRAKMALAQLRQEEKMRMTDSSQSIYKAFSIGSSRKESIVKSNGVIKAVINGGNGVESEEVNHPGNVVIAPSSRAVVT